MDIFKLGNYLKWSKCFYGCRLEKIEEGSQATYKWVCSKFMTEQEANNFIDNKDKGNTIATKLIPSACLDNNKQIIPNIIYSQILLAQLNNFPIEIEETPPSSSPSSSPSSVQPTGVGGGVYGINSAGVTTISYGQPVAENHNMINSNT